ncbi:rhodanese-like domain-containing protein [Yeosuana sp. MJ-SS3]|uniref:Rhodanese-like domain-containing protein n=1 Tax=Gilvirhabdus luticola TaxID=3079858 RepID=A0ABU3U4L6_9FLAO|nr:rhodanese-like domain-containing protein [Yeosuana sp. MJ-SS3]MDU8885355.1 rhodanese-like domain-containing protein [Yeosuana sp. MJ-SS3]
MKNLFFLCCLVTALFTASCKKDVKSSEEIITVISPEEMQELLLIDGVQLVDVRTPEEYNDGYIANSQNIDFKSPTFDEDIEKLDKNKPVILYCRSGGRSAKCAQKMKDAGFVKIYDLDGGISKWEHEGFEISLE